MYSVDKGDEDEEDVDDAAEARDLEAVEVGALEPLGGMAVDCGCVSRRAARVFGNVARGDAMM